MIVIFPVRVRRVLAVSYSDEIAFQIFRSKYIFVPACEIGVRLVFR